MSEPQSNQDKYLEAIAKNTASMASSLADIATYLSRIIVGVSIKTSPPQTDMKEPDMKTPTIKLIKKSALPTARAGAAKATATAPKSVSDFVLVDNENDTLTIMGIDAAGNPVDISSVATIAASTSDPTILTADPPTGMTVKMTAVGKLSTPGAPVVLTVVATWNDGSVGPFTATLPVDVVAGGPTGILIVPGVPAIN